jgi:hypothetical protein
MTLKTASTTNWLIEESSESLPSPTEGLLATKDSAASQLSRIKLKAISSTEFLQSRSSDSQHETHTSTTAGSISSSASSQLRHQTIRSSYIVKQEWEGVVEAIVDDVVTARLFDVREAVVERRDGAEIPLDLFSSSDRERLRVGSIFRWMIGIEKRGSTQLNISNFVVRHLPAWSKREVDEAFVEADQLLEGLIATDQHFGVHHNASESDRDNHASRSR